MQQSLTRFVGFLKELRRRKLYSAVVAYVAISLVLIEVADALVEALELPGVTHQVLILVLMLGFPLVVALSWIFDFGPEGLHRTEARDEAAVRGAPHATAGSVLPLRVRPGGPAPPGRTSSPYVPRISSPPPAPAPVKPPAEPETAPPPDPERVRRISLAHVRHELKTPINAIIGYSEMLLEDATEAGEDTVASDLGKIRAAGRQLLSLVEQILDPDREGETDLESYGARIRADLRNPVNAVTGYAEMLVEECRESAAAWLVPDLERIRTAALRLLELSNDIVQLASVEGDSDGPGASLSRASALAEGVLAKLGPLAADAAAVNRQGVLLVVDDNAVNRDLVSRQLARKGYQVATAEHGRQALERLAEQPVDLVLLDVLMPEMDGIETLRRIRAQPRLRGVPVIMMSSLDAIDGAIRCIEIGAEDYLAKPIHPAMLDVRIGASLEVRRLRAREELYRARLEQGDAAAGRLLRSLFPASVAARLQGGEADIVDASAEVGALCCDLGRAVAGGPLVEPAERVGALGWLLDTFEAEAGRQGLDALVVEGSVVLLLAGLPTPVTDPAGRLASVALRVLEAIRSATGNGEAVPLRFGMHSGAATGAVVGGERLVYHVWGDAVDLARRLAAQAGSGEILASPVAYGLLKGRYDLAGRGIVDVPGRGQMRTFVLTGGPVTAGV